MYSHPDHMAAVLTGTQTLLSNEVSTPSAVCGDSLGHNATCSNTLRIELFSAQASAHGFTSLKASKNPSKSSITPYGCRYWALPRSATNRHRDVPEPVPATSLRKICHKVRLFGCYTSSPKFPKPLQFHQHFAQVLAGEQLEQCRGCLVETFVDGLAPGDLSGLDPLGHVT